MDERLTHFLDRVPHNIRGKFFITDHCRACGLCFETAPEFFRPDTALGHSYVYRQPVGADEEAKCREALEACPTQSIYDFGDSFDWDAHPPREGDIDKAA